MKKLSALRNGVILLTGTLVLFAGVASSHAEDGIIDSQTVFANYTDYRKALREYNALTTQARKQINREILSEKDEARRQTLKKQYDTYCAEQSKRLLLPLQERTKKTVAQIAKERGLERVYEVGVKPDNNGLDITNVVIFTLNSQSPVVSRQSSEKQSPVVSRQSSEKQAISDSRLAIRKDAEKQSPVVSRQSSEKPAISDSRTKAVGVLLAHDEHSESNALPSNTRLSTERSESISDSRLAIRKAKAPASSQSASQPVRESANPPLRQSSSQPVRESASPPILQSAKIQFFAGYGRAEAEAAVSRAGRIASDVRLEEGKDKSGNTLWRGYAYCATQAQAKELCSRLSRAGFGCFVVK